MAIITEDMKRVVSEQRLGFIATVCDDGTPNVSPKGTTYVWDDDHLTFADICSPGTIANLRARPVVEINVVDPFVRKGYRFKGSTRVFDGGERFDELIAFFRAAGVSAPINNVVLVKVEFAAELVSPLYDAGASEAEVRARWDEHFASLAGRR